MSETDHLKVRLSSAIEMLKGTGPGIVICFEGDESEIVIFKIPGPIVGRVYPKDGEIVMLTDDPYTQWALRDWKIERIQFNLRTRECTFIGTPRRARRNVSRRDQEPEIITTAIYQVLD